MMMVQQRRSLLLSDIYDRQNDLINDLIGVYNV